MNKRKNKCLNEKMDCFVKTSAEKEAIYEIYRSCRLCGGGAGYKMPIIQNVVNITTDDVELKDKIRECVQIEVSQDDKMPPLICELCVDKISDFYDFLEMCRRTNKRTRLRLGLPPQALVRDTPDAGDCILGITEPVYIKKETNTSNTKKKGKVIKGKDVKVKKEPVVPVKQEKPKGLSRELRELLISSKSDKIKKAEAMSRRNTKPEKIQEKVQKTKTVTEPEPKSILKRRDDSSSSNTLKRTREKEVQKRSDVQPKKVKIVETRATRTSCHDIVDDDDDEDDEIINNKVPCKICKKKYQIGVSLNNHMRTHKVPEKIIHKCNKCKKTFATSRELDRHKCVTESKRTSNVKETEVKETTVECKYCNKPFNSIASMHGHVARCKKRPSTTSSTTVIQPSVRKRLKPIQVRTVRCDPILVERDSGHFDVSHVVCPYGLDKNCVYPYQNTQRSSLLSEDKMVVIRDDITNSFELEDYVHWDSDSGTDESDIYIEKRRKVESLSSIALKTIFSEKFLGKVPKKKRKVKMENALDSILNASEVDNDFRLDIDSIIHNLGDDKSERDSVSIKILNVFSQKETDYDSDRTSFNDEFDTVQSNTSNLKSSLSFNKDVNDETSTNSIDSMSETSILQNLKGDELKTLLDTDTTLNLEGKVKNDNVTDSDENVTNESKDKTQNESSNTDLNGDNDTSVNLNRAENKNQSEESNHNSEDADLRLDTEDKSAQINDSVSKNKEINNDISNGDAAKTSIDENLKESDSHEEFKESKKDESNTENAENTSKNVIVTKDPSKNAKSIDSTSINDIVNSVEALSVSCVENCSENTNLEGSKSNSGTNTCYKSVEDGVNDIKCNEISNTVKECSDIIDSAENFNNTYNYEENTSVKENVVENNSEISNDSKNNSDNTNSADNLSQEDTKTEDIIENVNSDSNIDKMNINNTENISSNTNQTAETNKIASTDGNFDKIDHIETNDTESTANSDKIDANNTHETCQNTENIDEFDKNGDVDSDNFNMDDLEDVSDTDIDDNKLMDDINDQLNQNNDLNNPLNQNNDINDQLNQDNDKNDKITLDDLLTKGQNDLDSISDGEFTLDE